MQVPVALPNDSSEEAQETAAINVVAIDVAALVAAAGDVPDGTGMFETKLA
jgi:hypothetical protein